MKKQSFDLNWEFTELTGFAAIFNPSAWRPVTLPHDAMISKPRAANNPTGNGGAYFPGGVANYRKKFHVPEEWRGQSVQLEFEGVYMNAEVSVNNQLLCNQPYGYSSFIVDITPWAWEPVLDTWTFPGQEGRVTQVDVYSIDEEVEVLVNGVSAGRKAAGAACQNKASFDVLYQPGTIEAVGYTGGRETGRHRLVTASEPAVLSLSTDRAVVKAGGGDLAYVTIEVQDRDGIVVKHGEPFIGVEVTGAGELIAIGSGNPLSDEMYVGNQHRAYHGRLLAIVRSVAQAGAITLTARAEGLPAARIELQAQ